MALPLLYKNVLPVRKDLLFGVRVTAEPPHYGFAARVNNLPVFGGEFPVACLHYPIAFARVHENEHAVTPILLLGMSDQGNLFLDREGRWRVPYIPAYVRRYPFILGERMTNGEIAVYVESAGLRYDGEGEVLYTDAGNSTPFLDGTLEFLRVCQEWQDRTLDFTSRLIALDLLVEREINLELSEGLSHSLRGILVVDEERLNILDDEPLLDLFRAGYLGWIYSHLYSMANLNRMIGYSQAEAMGMG
ncbi:MAG: SapC family protein [Magnetococcales bacterium]|nr:SapC family protein [Magnetococcales bacterium]